MKADKVILGEGAIYITDCEETGINNNVLVVGGSGCGKTMSIAEPRMLETLKFQPHRHCHQAADC